jgi:pimeloyl-ACP methyl ester carboxylesterase
VPRQRIRGDGVRRGLGTNGRELENANARKKEARMDARKSFVLVHGTSCGGWIWRRVAPLLRARGHDVFTPTLTGMGERSHLGAGKVDYEMHVRDILNVLEYEDVRNVVLVGHSYAGMVISGVAARGAERIAQLIYLDAYVPKAGESAMDLWPAAERAQALAEMKQGHGFRAVPPIAALGVTDPKDAEWVQKRLTPQPYHTYDQPAPVESNASAALRRVFIRCTVGPGVPRFAPSADRVRQQGGTVRDLAAPHFTMITAPKETADLLDDASI